MKVKQCLSYLKDNPKAGQEKAAQFRQQSTSNYKDRRAKIRTLQEDYFIPYDVDPDVIIDCFDDAILAECETIHLQEWDKKEVTNFTPSIRTLSAYMNDGIQPEIQAESLSPCVMATTNFYEEPEDDDEPSTKEYVVPQPHELFQEWKNNMLFVTYINLLHFVSSTR